jgi:gliding motility-associated-like protein
MKKFINKLAVLGILVSMFAPVITKSQALVGPAPFCMPTYGAWATPCNQGGPSNAPGNWINDFINSFSTAGAVVNISNNNSGCNAQNFPNIGSRNYFFYGCQNYLVVNPGQVINCTVQSGNVYGQGFAIFIDWNNNGVFNLPAERVAWTPNVPPAASFANIAFTVPAAQPAGAYRMRVRCAYAMAGTNMDPCIQYSYGEAEDYMVYVGQQPPGVITATAVSNSALCNGATLNLNVNSSASPTTALTYTWSGPGAFTSTLQSPVLANAQPTNSGVYSVTVSPGSCPVTSTVMVNIYPTPTITAISNDGPVCQGTTLNINAAANTSANVTYAWVGPNGFSANTLSTSITNVMPPASGFYTLTVTNSYTGAPYTQTAVCTTVGTTSAAVVPVASLAITPFFTLCQNSNLALTANAVGATSYSWTGPNNFNTTLANPVINNVNPIHSGDYSVTAYYVSPITTLVCTSNAVSNVSVVPRNPVNAFSSVNVCQNTTGTFSANAVAAVGYQWFGPNGFTSNDQTNVLNNIQPISSGNYSVNAIFAIGTVSCTTSSFIPLNVIAVPSIAVIPSIEVCEGEGTAFVASAPNAISYQWTGPNNFNLNSSNPMFTNLTPSMTGVYVVTAAFSNGNLTCYNSNQTQLTVKPRLPFNLGPDKQLCSNSDLFLNGPAGATSYNWWGSTSYTSNAQSLFVPSLGPGNSGIYVLEVDLNGCKTYDSVRVDILSPIIFTLTPNNKTVCRGDYVEFVVGAAQGSQNYAYTWNPAIYVTGPTGSVQAGQALGTTIYNIEAYDIACPDYKIQTNFTLTVNQPPVPQINLEKNNVCEPLCMVFNSNTQNQASLVTYDFGNDKVYQGDSINVCLPAGTHYMTIHTVGNNGCKGSFTYSNMPITVYPKPGADFTWDPSTPNTSNNVVTFYPSVKHGNQFDYSWELMNSTNVGGVDTSFVKNPSKVYDDNGKFPVMLVVKNEYGCVDTVYKVITIEEDVNIFIPNTFTPNDDGVNDVFNVKGLGLKKEGYLMEIFDRWGTLVYVSRDIDKGWDGTIKGVKATDGVYIYSVRVIGGSGVGKREFKGHVTLMK